MGMGHAAAYADTVTEDFVTGIAPMELENFKAALEKEEQTIESFATGGQFDDGENFTDFGDEVIQTYDELLTKFKEVTGLQLDLSYHDSEGQGSRYDDVDGAFWTVGGVYELSAAGKKYQEYINRAHYVSFG